MCGSCIHGVLRTLKKRCFRLGIFKLASGASHNTLGSGVCTHEWRCWRTCTYVFDALASTRSLLKGFWAL